MSDPTSAPDYLAITGRQQQTWATGDYHVVALTIVPVADALVAAADPRPGQRVLDVACGSGNVALAAARRFCDVTALDYVPALLERARKRAAAEGTAVDFREGDAQRLPFPDHAFDVALSAFGVMFAPDQATAAAELLRVCRPGGTIGLANWMPEGFGGEFFAIVARYAPPPPGLRPPTRWGTEAGLRELLGHGTRAIAAERRTVTAYYPSLDHAIDVFRVYFGPTRRAFEAVTNEGRRQAMEDDMRALFGKHNRDTDGTLAMTYEYLQVVARVA